MIRVTGVKRRADGAIETAKVHCGTRRDRARYGWAAGVADHTRMSWRSLFHLLLTRAERN